MGWEVNAFHILYVFSLLMVLAFNVENKALQGVTIVTALGMLSYHTYALYNKTLGARTV